MENYRKLYFSSQILQPHGVDFWTELLLNIFLQPLAQPMSITMSQWAILSWVSQSLREILVFLDLKVHLYCIHSRFWFFIQKHFGLKPKTGTFTKFKSSNYDINGWQISLLFFFILKFHQENYTKNICLRSREQFSTYFITNLYLYITKKNPVNVFFIFILCKK